MPKIPAPNRDNSLIYGPQKDHINIRVLHSGSKAQDKGDSRNHGL